MARVKKNSKAKAKPKATSKANTKATITFDFSDCEESNFKMLMPCYADTTRAKIIQPGKQRLSGFYVFYF